MIKNNIDFKQPYIRQIVVVEGKDDVASVLQAVRGFVVPTGGFFRDSTQLEKLAPLVEKRGICLLCDPDGPGKRIGQKVKTIFPNALVASLEQKDCLGQKGVGIEYAHKKAIVNALMLAGCQLENDFPTPKLSLSDLIAHGLAGGKEASRNRQSLGRLLGIHTSSAKNLLAQLHILEIDANLLATLVKKEIV